MQAKGAAKQARLKVLRQTLAIGSVRSTDPRYAARLAAALRADDLAKAIVDGPLDDRKLSTVERQRAALSALDATYPLQTVTAELSLSEDMDWQSMQSMAVNLLG